MPDDARPAGRAVPGDPAEFLRRVAARIRVERDLQPQWRQSGREAAMYLDEAMAAVIRVASDAAGAPYRPPAQPCRPAPRARRAGRKVTEASSLVLF